MELSLLNSDQGLHPLLESMAERIRKRRSELSDLVPLDLDPAMEHIYGTLEGDSLFIHNELHCAREIRKLHLEIAVMGRGLQILHCVFFPEPTFDIPIFGVDLVAGPTGISAAIVDLSPVSEALPEDVQNQLKTIAYPSFSKVRKLPTWGAIFSPFVHFIRPCNKDEEFCFLELVDNYLNIVLTTLSTSIPDEPCSTSTIERCRGQNYYCLQQKLNDKTRNVLAKAFNPQWADRYIEEVLFNIQ